MPLDQAGEGQFGLVSVAVGKSLEELLIGQPANPSRTEYARIDRKATPLTLLATGFASACWCISYSGRLAGPAYHSDFLKISGACHRGRKLPNLLTFRCTPS